MNKKVERDIEQFERLRLRLAGDKQAAHDFLVKAGIITEKGNLKAQYKNLCIPHEPA